jgi:hypothetical protein
MFFFRISDVFGKIWGDNHPIDRDALCQSNGQHSVCRGPVEAMTSHGKAVFVGFDPVKNEDLHIPRNHRPH